MTYHSLVSGVQTVTFLGYSLGHKLCFTICFTDTHPVQLQCILSAGDWNFEESYDRSEISNFILF